MPLPTHDPTTPPPWLPGMEGILYNGINWLAGAPGCGKTWIGLIAAKHYLTAQPHDTSGVQYNDHESSAHRMSERAHALDFTDAYTNAFTYRTSEGGYYNSLNIIDTADGANLMTTHNPREIEHDTFCGSNIILDHTARTTGSRHPAGDKRKTAIADAVIYIDGEHIWTRHRPGHITLHMIKDRHGYMDCTPGQELARITATPQDGKLNYQITRNNERHY